MKRCVLIGCALAMVASHVWAGPIHDQRALGLWQSENTYLELNADGTFFRVEQNQSDDAFGTYSVVGNVVHFTYGRGLRAVTRQKELYFESDSASTMRLMDAEKRSIRYHRVRDL